MRIALPVLVLLTLPGCCFIGCDEEIVVVPAARITVTDGERPISAATVTVAHYEEHPYYRLKESRTATANEAGLASFEIERGTVKQYPLMMHGVGFFAWQVCAEAPGYETRSVRWFSAGDDVDSLKWAAIDQGTPVDFAIELSEGESGPCSEAVEFEPFETTPEQLECDRDADCAYLEVAPNCCLMCSPVLANAKAQELRTRKCATSMPAECPPCEAVAADPPAPRCVAGVCRDAAR